MCATRRGQSSQIRQRYILGRAFPKRHHAEVAALQGEIIVVVLKRSRRLAGEVFGGSRLQPFPAARKLAGVSEAFETAV